MIGGHLAYIFFGLILFQGNRFLRWVAAVTLWQILTPPCELPLDLLFLIMSFGVAEAGYYYMENVRA